MPDKKEFIIFILLCIISLGLGYWYGLPDKPSQQRAGSGTPPAPTVVTNVVTNVLKEVASNTVTANPPPTPKTGSVGLKVIDLQETNFNGVLRVRANMLNLTGKRVEFQVGCSFKDAKGFLIGNELFQTLILDKDETIPVTFTASTSKAKNYSIQVKLSRTAPVKPRPTSTDIVPANTLNAVIEKEIRRQLDKTTDKLTEADLEKVTMLSLYGIGLTEVPKGLEKLTQLDTLVLYGNQLTSVNGLEKLTQLAWLNLNENKLTDLRGLEKLTELRRLLLSNNPDLTMAQIADLQKALPNYKIYSNASK